jgi:hypothetical protein
MKLNMYWLPSMPFVVTLIRYLVQEHMAFNIWSLNVEWEMPEPKEGSTIKKRQKKGPCEIKIYIQIYK